MKKELQKTKNKATTKSSWREIAEELLSQGNRLRARLALLAHYSEGWDFVAAATKKRLKEDSGEVVFKVNLYDTCDYVRLFKNGAAFMDIHLDMIENKNHAKEMLEKAGFKQKSGWRRKEWGYSCTVV